MPVFSVVKRVKMKRFVLPAFLSLAICYFVLLLTYRQGELPPHATTSELAQRLVANILAGKDRGTALCRLISLRRYRAIPRYEVERCTSRVVRQFIGSPNGEVFGVTVEVNFINDDEEAPYAGELVLFDREGFLIPVYGGSNLLTAEDGFFRYRGGDDWAIVHAIRTGAGTETVANVLSVVPLSREQRSVLQLIVGAPINSYDCRGFHWSWQARDADGDKVPEFEVGPNISPPGKISPRAVFRWSENDGRYSGPGGSPSEGWLRLDVVQGKPVEHKCCPNDAAKLYAETASNLEGVRKPCREPETIIIR